MCQLLPSRNHGGNLFFDIGTAVHMRGRGIREIYTTDTDFLQFPGIKAINPIYKQAPP